MTVRFTVNGRPVAVDVPDARPLLDTLRDDLGLTGAKECCGKGECGSCLVFTAQADGAAITTVEGIGSMERLDAVQQAFVAEGAAQCGYCIPGFIVAARALLDRTPQPTEAEVREALAGNICRCTGYQKILTAVVKAGARHTKAGGDATRGCDHG